MIRKLCALLCVLSAIACVNAYLLPVKCAIPPYNATGTHSLFAGCVTPFDKLLCSQAFRKPSKWWTTRLSTIRYPPPGYYRNETITGIWIFDNERNKTGGYAIVKNGGVGYRNATIELRSTWSKGFNFQVSIYGH